MKPPDANPAIWRQDPCRACLILHEYVFKGSKKRASFCLVIAVNRCYNMAVMRRRIVQQHLYKLVTEVLETTGRKGGGFMDERIYTNPGENK